MLVCHIDMINIRPGCQCGLLVCGSLHIPVDQTRGFSHFDSHNISDITSDFKMFSSQTSEDAEQDVGEEDEEEVECEDDVEWLIHFKIHAWCYSL